MTTHNSGSVKPLAIAGKYTEPMEATYLILKDIPYGLDHEQTMDIYLSNDPENVKQKNFTIIFLHGGGFYMSDKSKEQKYIQPYLNKGMNVVNMNYRLKRGIAIATEDLTTALNFLKSGSSTYPLNFQKVILTGFSAGAHIASLVGLSPNNFGKLSEGISFSGIINFSGAVDGLEAIEKGFINNKIPLMSDIGHALFPSYKGYTPIEVISKYEPITYFDKYSPPFFLWYGGQDDQIPPATFEKFVNLLNESTKKNEVIFSPKSSHFPKANALENAYDRIFMFLDRL
jgi:acetyl esterase/lipase